jgi:hypothetical protein
MEIRLSADVVICWERSARESRVFEMSKSIARSA